LYKAARVEAILTRSSPILRQHGRGNSCCASVRTEKVWRKYGDLFNLAERCERPPIQPGRGWGRIPRDSAMPRRPRTNKLGSKSLCRHRRLGLCPARHPNYCRYACKAGIARRRPAAAAMKLQQDSNGKPPLELPASERGSRACAPGLAMKRAIRVLAKRRAGAGWLNASSYQTLGIFLRAHAASTRSG